MAATMQAESRPDLQLLKAADVARLLRVSVRQVWRLVASGALPEPVKLAARTVRWREADLAAWLEGRG